MKLARHYQAILDSGKVENRGALARRLDVSRARVTSVLHRLAAKWRKDCNEFRSHGSLGQLSPADFACRYAASAAALPSL